MKFVIRAVFVVFAILANIGCTKEDNAAVDGTIQISLNIDNSLLKSTSADEIKSIVISITDNNDLMVYDTEVIELTNFNGNYLSKPISLKPGDYKVTQFHVVNINGKVVYSTPMEDSKKAYLVEDPLPLVFSVTKDKITKISPEVLCVDDDAIPSDFGYSTFTFNVVETFDFLVSVFVYNPIIENYELTNATIKVTGNGSCVFTDSIQAITNKITVRDGCAQYDIEINKPLYKTFTGSYNVDSLKAMFNSPLMVVLEKNDSIPGLVAHYPLDGNANDVSGNDKHGTDFGASGYLPGFNLQARDFTNSPDANVNATDYVTIPNVINSAEFTVNFWAKFSISNTHQSLIYLCPEENWVAANFWLEVGHDMKLAVIFNGLDLRTADYTHQALKDGLFNDTYLNTKPLELNKFQNITCTFKNSEVALYIDGEEVARYYNINRTVGTPDVPILLGVCPKPGMLYYPFVGQMDDLKFYNRALNDDEIKSLQNN